MLILFFPAYNKDHIVWLDGVRPTPINFLTLSAFSLLAIFCQKNTQLTKLLFRVYKNREIGAILTSGIVLSGES